MLFELVTSSIFGGIAFHAFMKKKNLSANDSGKIQRIMSLSGLNVKDGKDTLTTQLIKKKKYEWGWEYKYKIPLGRCFNDYLSKVNVLEDGLNNRRKQLNFNDVLALYWKGDVLKNLQQLWKSKLTEQKEIELDFDGLLIIRVYDNPMPKKVDFHAGESWKVPVGVARTLNSFRYHDFEKVPHIILGGATRYGKSNLINSIICSLLHSNSGDVKFYLIDLKGGVELCDYENIKQTVSVAYELEEALETLQLAYNHMRSIQSELRKRGKKSVQEAGMTDRYFIIVDEVGELNPSEAVTKEEKLLKQQCQTIMSQIARIGAGLGFRQILATQYPTGDVINRACKQNSDAKLSFRVQSAIASRVVLDAEGAESLPQIKGRAIYQTADRREILQTPLITTDVIKSIILPNLINEEESDEKETLIQQRGTDIVTFTEV
ncbi:FtsK/SpoIIIE domain-containing protein [Lysinibacillus irui]|uniref:FtsK/SpoIIIE domain-containing protein n=1 Tax=Lysinibacillus irui TaxID=2998077 RepID=A0ABU5NQN1_9BACI|nr:FtsK/SpoIIIE domain-containing protein [Lysinibacillus irui]MEA0556092.1 FtsK/SpoIIIE domain-containing protein [Lysinibacillus irui]MEA0978346.1 FtsK/SpoIIIE domain-containing protein [Lysinibacillus irui]MEA1044500.1 FtsK/SpoIIIE domain-containing protein [Lysinibacillus irui]